jgi:hypothetical protein
MSESSYVDIETARKYLSVKYQPPRVDMYDRDGDDMVIQDGYEIFLAGVLHGRTTPDRDALFSLVSSIIKAIERGWIIARSEHVRAYIDKFLLQLLNNKENI